ncbi:hypothetical protein JW964_21875 [candidate division KSB1 bacterium]|nr:hypothetical protein [candidate division KSB1 bacterium]
MIFPKVLSKDISKQTFISFLIVILLGTSIYAKDFYSKSIYPPQPVSIEGVTNPSISLNGTWKFNLNPPKKFQENHADFQQWVDIKVPGECVMQGFNLQQDQPAVYKRKIQIPADYAEKQILLRFDGVYSYARVWVNGHFIREHHGGFTTWDCYLTDFVKPDETAWLAVEITDRSDEISWGSAYAKHNIGGILRDVHLMALPPTFLKYLHINTVLDQNYQHADLIIDLAVHFANSKPAEFELMLFDPENKKVVIQPGKLQIEQRSAEKKIVIPVKNPQKWDAEHPRLYSLQIKMKVAGKITQTVEQKIGFRVVEQKGNKQFVNGQEVKLLGVNRHSVHPTQGRAVSTYYDTLDVKLFREANVNFIRTSHYPPSKTFLDVCDRLGMYVEEENALCFVSTHGNLPSSADSTFTMRYFGQFSEMIARDRNHPSVILWSLGNESVWGSNVQMLYNYLRQEEPSRPVILSYPITVPPDQTCYQIFSWHYPSIATPIPLFSLTNPVLFDEFAHVACYNVETLRNDPGVRDYWGKSIKLFADYFYQTEGVLGGAIWGGIDEVFQVPFDTFQKPAWSGDFSKYGYGEWGIIDGWRRKKTEFWHTKKAFSPIKIQEDFIFHAGKDQSLSIPIANRFHHTNLNEIKILWKAGADSGTINNLNIPPHSSGFITVPPRSRGEDEKVQLKFLTASGNLIDQFEIPVYPWNCPRWFQTLSPADYGVKLPTPHLNSAVTPQLIQKPKEWRVEGKNFYIIFDKSTGLIKEGRYEDRLLIEGGPFLQFNGTPLPDWKLTAIQTQLDSMVTIDINGQYGDTKVEYKIGIDGTGQMQIKYKIDTSIPLLPSKALAEFGLAFYLPNNVDRLSWERKGLWSVYPVDQIGRIQGTAYRFRDGGTEKYGIEPTWPCSQDMKNFFLNGPRDEGYGATQDFLSLKANVLNAAAILTNSDVQIQTESDGRIAVRLAVKQINNEDRILFLINHLWNYPDLGWGNWMETISTPRQYSNEIFLKLTNDEK